METKKTRQEKFVEQKKKFDKERRKTVVWDILAVITMMIICEIGVLVLIRLGGVVIPTSKLYMGVFILGSLYLVITLLMKNIRMEIWNMKKKISDLQSELTEERESLAKLERDLPLLLMIPFGQIPSELKESAYELLNKDYSSEEILEDIREGIEDMEVELEIYQQASPTYLSYLFSGQWLKKVK